MLPTFCLILPSELITRAIYTKVDIMKTTDRFLRHNHQHGGMLMEMMLSVALAAITIPFVARYQKNTIERARNVAVVKQMDIVRGALERCIMENRSIFLLQTGNFVFSENNMDPSKADCLILSDDDGVYGLINYGLTPEFVNDYKNDYSLRIRKSKDDTGQAVLQGIVLLKNGNVNTLSTREIVNLGGGQVGFTDGNYVRGGFNAFSTEKTNYGLTTDDQGIIQTTETTRGDSKYLWRTADASQDDRTMLSFLNLDGHDITNMSGFSASKAYFSNRITLDPAYPSESGKTINVLKFSNHMNLNNTNLTGENAIMNGNFVADSQGATLTANNDLTVLSDSSVKNLKVYCNPYKDDNNVFYCNNSIDFSESLVLPVCKDEGNENAICMRNVNIDFYKCKANNKMELFQLESTSGLIRYTEQAIASHLRLGLSGDENEQIMAVKENDIYYIKNNTANFKQINLEASLKTQSGSVKQGLNELINYVIDAEPNLYEITTCNNSTCNYNTSLNGMYGAAWSYFNDGEDAHDVGFYLKKFRYMQHMLMLKMECATPASANCIGIPKIKNCISSSECRAKVGSCKSADFNCVREIINRYWN
jgi:hypothetical protein